MTSEALTITNSILVAKNIANNNYAYQFFVTITFYDISKTNLYSSYHRPLKLPRMFHVISINVQHTKMANSCASAIEYARSSI